MRELQRRWPTDRHGLRGLDRRHLGRRIGRAARDAETPIPGERGPLQPRRQARRHRLHGSLGAPVGRRDRGSATPPQPRRRSPRGCLSPDGQVLATSSSDRTARLWSTATGDRLATFRHDDMVTGVAFSASGEHLLTSSLDRTARVWRATSRAEISRTAIKDLPAVDHAVEIRTTPDGSLQLDVLDDDDRRAVVRRSSDGAELFQLKHAERIRSATFSPDGRIIATAGDDNIARLWSAETGRELHLLRHHGPVYQAEFNADGTRLLTVTKVYEYNGEDIARLWDVTTATMLQEFPPGDVRHAKFGTDGATVVTYCDDGFARTWDATFTLSLRDEALVREVARTRLRGKGRLTDEEVLILGPVLGEGIERDVLKRWHGP